MITASYQNEGFTEESDIRAHVYVKPSRHNRMAIKVFGNFASMQEDIVTNDLKKRSIARKVYGTLDCQHQHNYESLRL